ncbi:MAG: hypothetical protein WD577_01185 [Bacteroidales bacterium]
MACKYPDELDFFRKSRLPLKRSLQGADDKIVMIWGTNSGVGHATAKQFATMGASLVLLVRDRERRKLVK